MNFPQPLSWCSMGEAAQTQVRGAFTELALHQQDDNQGWCKQVVGD